MVGRGRYVPTRQGAARASASPGKVAGLGRWWPRASPGRGRTIENRFEEQKLHLEDLEEDLREAVAEIDQEWDEKAGAIEPLEISPEKNDINVDEVALLWLPVG
jgi:hypothetical protein